MNLIQKYFETEIPETEVRKWLENKIRQMLDQETDLLWSTLYRMDVNEEKIKQVLASAHHTPVEPGLAGLVLERQKQRNEIRARFSASKPPEDDTASF